MGSAMASMPHFMSSGVNELTASGIEKSVNGLMSMTTLSVTAVEEITVFVIGILTNTYLCLITFAITGSLGAVIEVIRNAQDDINKISERIGGEIGDGLKGFSDAFNKIADDLGDVPLLGKTINIPDIPNFDDQINEMKEFKLPDSLDDKLRQLNDSLPTFDEVKQAAEDVIRLPFREVKELMAEKKGNFTFDRSLFAVPAKERLTFCSDSDGINDFFDKLEDLASLAKKIFIAVLVIAAVAACIPMGWREIRRWRMQQERAMLVSAGATEPMDTVYLVSRPYTSSFGLKMARIPQNPTGIVNASRSQNWTRWAVAYATTDAALFVLCLGIAGLFSCLCQYILLAQIRKSTPALSNQVGVFADKVVAQLNNASEQWAIATNGAIGDVNRDINNDMLGWVNITTSAINGTINTFVDETMKILNTTFGDTPLFDPVKEVLNCLVLLKVQGVQKALTWVSDNAHVDFPTLPNDTFTRGALASLSDDDPSQSFLSEPGDQASDKITSIVTRFIGWLEDGIRTEALISTFVLLTWVVIALIGAGYALFCAFGHKKNRGDGGSVLPMEDLSTARAEPGAVDFRSDNQDRFTLSRDEPAPEYTERVEKRPRTQVGSVHNPFGDESQYQNEKLGVADNGRRNRQSGKEGLFF